MIYLVGRRLGGKSDGSGMKDDGGGEKKEEKEGKRPVKVGLSGLEPIPRVRSQ
jgi:hypothetical protein